MCPLCCLCPHMEAQNSKGHMHSPDVHRNSKKKSLILHAQDACTPTIGSKLTYSNNPPQAWDRLDQWPPNYWMRSPRGAPRNVQGAQRAQANPHGEGALHRTALPPAVAMASGPAPTPSHSSISGLGPWFGCSSTSGHSPSPDRSSAPRPWPSHSGVGRDFLKEDMESLLTSVDDKDW